MTPLILVLLVFIVGPIVIFSAGVWVGRGMPGLPVTIRFERRDRVTHDDWQP
jgi:hypothetical protein